MKNILFALILFSISPLCAMEKEKLTAQEQEALDTELNDLMPLCAMEKELEKEKRAEQEQKELDDKLFALIDLIDPYSEERIPEHKQKYVETVKELLRAGANQTAQKMRFCSNLELSRILLDHATDTDLAPILHTRFHFAALFSETNGMAYLILKGQARRLNVKDLLLLPDRDGVTALTMAEKRAASHPDREYPINMLQIVTDPDKNIPLLCPEVALRFKLEQTGSRNVLEYLRNREIGRKR